MIKFYFHPTPNPAKIALFLEETGLPYGEQHTPAFWTVNPNGKVPAIIDTDGPGGREAANTSNAAPATTAAAMNVAL